MNFIETQIIGDVAILLSAGMSLKQTLFYNLLSTVTCFIGFVIGVMLGSIETFLRYVFGFSGGMFLYIALSCMVLFKFFMIFYDFLMRYTLACSLFIANYISYTFIKYKAKY